jgi:16S rRNA (cytidine1402-2'-O)-methyltransferase
MSDYVGSLVYYVGPHHLKKYLDDMRSVLGNRPVCVARELTKLHQELLRGSVDEIAARLSEISVRGEITVVVGGAGLESDFFD